MTIIAAKIEEAVTLLNDNNENEFELERGRDIVIEFNLSKKTSIEWRYETIYDDGKTKFFLHS